MPAAANLDGTVNGGGGPAQTTWTMVDGPGTVTFTNASAVDTTARFSAPGSYTLRLTANNGVLSAFDDMVVTVRQLPSVSAGPNLTITLASSASLDGTLLNPGSPGPVTFRWTRAGGPGGSNAVIFTSSTSIDTSVRFTRTGTFTLRLTATNGAGSASDDVEVTVNR
jgi:PKD repeat protein